MPFVVRSRSGSLLDSASSRGLMLRFINSFTIADGGLCTKNTSRALIERPYSCAPQAVGAVYDRPGFFVQSPDGACEATSRSDEEAMLINRDESRRRDRPQPPSALRVAAERPRLRCRSSVTMNEHCALVAPRIRGRCARNDGKAIYETQD